MVGFFDRDFLLNSKTARRLYYDFAADQPIIDYHSHLPQGDILGRKKFRNMAAIWLGEGGYGDHYKWRLMRAAGIDESLITGDAPEREKFNAFCRILPLAAGNPIYHFSHLELRRIFGIEDVAISEKTADKIWEEGNARLQELDTWALLKQARVEIACTTDDPADDLAQHRELAGTELETRILPAFRPDKAIRIADPAFTDYLGKLGAAAGIGITSFAALAEALVRRVKFFHENGSRISDHALDKPLPAKVATAAEVEAIFAKRLKGEPLSDAEQGQHALAVLVEVGRAYHAHDWAMCFHIGAQRNNSSRKLKTMGPDVGADSASDIAAHSPGVATLLDRLDSTDQLPRTMLFGIDGQMNLWLSTLTGCFQDGKVVGKLQFGPAWWFNDHKEGNLRQMIDLANNGLLGTFVGMVTDSRSFASYPRHDYFRRLLCRLVGGWVDEGEYPDDAELLGTLIRGVCYENAKAYFRF